VSQSSGLEVPSPPLVVVGASAGGVEALRELASRLPADLPACVLVVLHVPAASRSALPSILERAGALPARHATSDDELQAGQILVAPPDHHLVVVGGRVALTRGPQENGHRPAVDVLFRSAARSHGPRVFAAVLSGALDDGAAGVVAVTSRGGAAVVQDFDEALYPGMPMAAARAVALDRGVPLASVPGLLADWLADLPAGPDADPTALMDMETEMSEMNPEAMHDLDRPGVPAGFGCPDCAGALYEIEEGRLIRFRCRVGHAWSPESLLESQGLALEGALWMALRSLEEKAALNSQLGRRAQDSGFPQSAERFSANAEDALYAAEQVRRLVEQIGTGPGRRLPSDEGPDAVAG
jgi:two-component system chemotaxis response regulator CheB